MLGVANLVSDQTLGMAYRIEQRHRHGDVGDVAKRQREGDRAKGEIAAKPMGGDRHSHRTETHATLILQVLENRSQAYLREVRASLQEHGVVVSLSGLSRFFRRHGITRKKGRLTRPSRTVQT